MLLLFSVLPTALWGKYVSESARIWRNISLGYDNQHHPTPRLESYVTVNLSTSLFRLASLSEADEMLTIQLWNHWVRA